MLISSLLLGGSTGAGAEDSELGDINADGSINSSDALLALQHSVAIVTLTGGTGRAGGRQRGWTDQCV